MELNTALQKLKEYERRGFALYHASGIIYYDGATTAPKGSAGVRAITNPSKCWNASWRIPTS